MPALGYYDMQLLLCTIAHI